MLNDQTDAYGDHLQTYQSFVKAVRIILAVTGGALLLMAYYLV